MRDTPLLPPTHVIDAPGTFIALSDPAWDHLGRLNAEVEALARRGAEDARAAAVADLGHEPATDDERTRVADAADLASKVMAASHPVLRYARGETRFQLDAPLPGPAGAPCRPRDYLRPGIEPTRFIFMRPGRRRIRAVEAIDSTDERREAWIRAVVRKIEGPEGRLSWAPERDSDEVPEPVLEDMFRWAGPSLIRQLADACKAYCAPLMEHEGKL